MKKVQIILIPFILIILGSCLHLDKQQKDESYDKENVVLTKTLSDTPLQSIVKKISNKEIKIDTTSIIIIKNNRYTIYFIKVNDVVEDGLINPFGQYIGVCMNNNTNEYSQRYTCFSDEMIELLDQDWENESLRLKIPPYLQINDFDGDGVEELRIKQRVYNGTMYHAVVNRFYGIDSVTLELNYKFSVEELSLLPKITTYPRTNELYIKRILDNKQVKVYLCKNVNDTGRLIGEYSIEINEREEMENTNIKIYDEDFEVFIVSVHPMGNIPDVPSLHLLM